MRNQKPRKHTEESELCPESWLRRYYPKGTDFCRLSEEELQAAITEINNQPRKCLGWFTPAEVFDEHLHLETIDQCRTSE